MRTETTIPASDVTARRGFTLLEVLMSAFVIALGSLGLLALFAGAATQQQQSAQLTDSVTLSKNAESRLRAAFENFGTDTQLGCNAPLFETDAWYCLFADQRFGFLTVNPSDDPLADGLYFEAEPRSGQTPITLYSATTDAANQLVLGVAELVTNPVTPFSYGSPALDVDLGDRRLLLRAQDTSDDLRVTFTYRTIRGNSSTQTIGISGTNAVEYVFNGDCTDASTNAVYLGTSGNQPTDRFQDHVRINTQIIPVDGTNNASLLSFRVNEVEALTDQVAVRVNTATGEPTTPLVVGPSEFISRADYEGVSWIDATGGGTGPEVWVAPTAAPAQFTSIPSDPRTGTLTRLTNMPVTDPADLTPMNNASVGFAVGTRVPDGATAPTGPFVIPGDFATGVRYTTTDPMDGSLPAGRLRELLYSPNVITGITIGYKRRADELISLSDRLNFVPDPNFVGGRRPDMAYSVLYRDRGGRGSDQFVVFTYTLTPSSNDARWFPPETADDVEQGRAPIRRIRGANLIFDRGTERYIVTVDEDDAWVARRGSLLLFAGGTQGAVKGPGAEGVVRVTQIIERANGRRDLVLEEPPRAGGATLLDLFYPDAFSGEFDIWAVQDIVTSRADDSEWVLEPIEARVFQAGE